MLLVLLVQLFLSSVIVVVVSSFMSLFLLLLLSLLLLHSALHCSCSPLSSAMASAAPAMPVCTRYFDIE
jgi:hypothetical protein